MGLAQKCAEYINSVKKSSVMQTCRMTLASAYILCLLELRTMNLAPILFYFIFLLFFLIL